MLLQITSAYNAISASGAQLKSLPQYVAKTALVSIKEDMLCITTYGTTYVHTINDDKRMAINFHYDRKFQIMSKNDKPFLLCT